tara:strand:- start:439 stop:864 length:426 start_codon:yes stop_codon:yes gene_type:complete
MPETSKTYANIEILQGADYEITVTLDNNTDSKSYMVTIVRDYTGSTDFGGREHGDGTSANPYRTEITETNVATIGQLVTSNGTATVQLKLYAQWTETLDDDFDGFWEMVEKDGTSYSRIAQGEIYVNNSSSRYATTQALSG